MVTSGNKSLPRPVLTQIYGITKLNYLLYIPVYAYVLHLGLDVDARGLMQHNDWSFVDSMLGRQLISSD